MELSGILELSLIWPPRLAEKLPWRSAPPTFRPRIEPLIRGLPERELLTKAELETALAEHLTESERSWVCAEAWRGSIASHVYERVRCGAVHDLGAFWQDFGSITYRGGRMRPVDFDLLHGALQRVLAVVRQDSALEPTESEPT